jgi:FixJ family two-component response regulator
LPDRVHTISLIDDNDGIRRAFKALLEHAGFDVTAYASGREFLDSGLAQKPDCILLDLEMPSLNGIDVLDAMGDITHIPPIIIVTGTNEPALIAAADRDIVTGFIRKPIASEALLAAVKRAVKI